MPLVGIVEVGEDDQQQSYIKVVYVRLLHPGRLPQQRDRDKGGMTPETQRTKRKASDFSKAPIYYSTSGVLLGTLFLGQFPHRLASGG